MPLSPRRLPLTCPTVFLSLQESLWAQTLGQAFSLVTSGPRCFQGPQNAGPSPERAVQAVAPSQAVDLSEWALWDSLHPAVAA